MMTCLIVDAADEKRKKSWSAWLAVAKRIRRSANNVSTTWAETPVVELSFARGFSDTNLEKVRST